MFYYYFYCVWPWWLLEDYVVSQTTRLSFDLLFSGVILCFSSCCSLLLWVELLLSCCQYFGTFQGVQISTLLSFLSTDFSIGSFKPICGFNSLGNDTNVQKTNFCTISMFVKFGPPYSVTLFEIFIFCPEIQLWFSKKIVDFFVGEKLVKMLWFWTF